MSNDKFKSQDSSEIVTLDIRKLTATVTVLEFLAALVTSPMMTTLLKRLGLLAEGGWLPGNFGDVRTIAALTNRPESSINEITSSNPREKLNVGRQVMYRMDQFAKPNIQADDVPNDAPAMRKKK